MLDAGCQILGKSKKEFFSDPVQYPETSIQYLLELGTMLNTKT
jgi:hypothetical protein